MYEDINNSADAFEKGSTPPNLNFSVHNAILHFHNIIARYQNCNTVFSFSQAFKIFNVTC